MPRTSFQMPDDPAVEIPLEDIGTDDSPNSSRTRRSYPSRCSLHLQPLAGFSRIKNHEKNIERGRRYHEGVSVDVFTGVWMVSEPVLARGHRNGDVWDVYRATRWYEQHDSTARPEKVSVSTRRRHAVAFFLILRFWRRQENGASSFVGLFEGEDWGLSLFNCRRHPNQKKVVIMALNMHSFHPLQRFPGVLHAQSGVLLRLLTGSGI